MGKFGMACLLAAGLVFGATPGHGEDGSTDKLTKALLADVDPGSIPSGYKFLLTEPFAIGEAPEEKKIAGAIHALFERPNRLPGQPEFDGGYEGFAFVVFPAAADARAYAGSNAAQDGYTAWAGEVFKPHGPQTSSNVTIKAPDGTGLAWQCRAIDYVIRCIRVESAVVAEVNIQEPTLRDATSESERKSTIERRAQAEAGGLFKAALLHLARARKDAGL